MLRFRYFLAAALLLAAGGCGLLGGPKSALTKFLKAEQAGRWADAYGLASSEDRAAKSLDAYLKEKDEDRASQMRLGLTPALELYRDRGSVEIAELKSRGDRASARVVFRVPDADAMMRAILGDSFAAAITDAKLDGQELAKMLSDKYKDQPVPLRTEDRTFELRKEGGGWRVVLDWVREKKLKEMAASAEGLAAKRDWAGARAAYEGLLKLEADPSRAAEEKARLAELEAQAYLDHVVLQAVRVRRTDHAGEAPEYLHVVEVAAQIQNRGNRALNMVSVTVELLDARGATFRTERFSPILPGSATSSQPLLPGQSRYFHSVILSAPAGWRAKAKVYVSEVKLGG